MQVHYLEIVTSDIDTLCDIYSAVHGVEFDQPDQALGNARTAKLADGGMIGIRAPMHSEETPETRAYVLVDNVESALEAAVAKGGEIAHPAFELPGHGIFGIFQLDGLHHGLWQC